MSPPVLGLLAHDGKAVSAHARVMPSWQVSEVLILQLALSVPAYAGPALDSLRQEASPEALTEPDPAPKKLLSRAPLGEGLEGAVFELTTLAPIPLDAAYPVRASYRSVELQGGATLCRLHGNKASASKLSGDYVFFSSGGKEFLSAVFSGGYLESLADGEAPDPGRAEGYLSCAATDGSALTRAGLMAALSGRFVVKIISEEEQPEEPPHESIETTSKDHESAALTTHASTDPRRQAAMDYLIRQGYTKEEACALAPGLAASYTWSP